MQIASIALSVALGVTTLPVVASVGCYPAYSSGATYDAGSVASFNSTNYKCVSGWQMYCSGNQPPGEPGQIATVAWSSMGACSGTQALPQPTPKPTPNRWDKTGCPEAFAAGSEYEDGDVVSFNNIVYKCKGTGTAANWCGASMYEPEVGLYWSSAWEILGSCTGVIAPTASPVFPAGTPGCPADYDDGKKDYQPGDRVAIGSLVYQCNPAPMSAFCNVYGPDDNENGGGALGWKKIGGCSGTIEPTTSPTNNAANRFDQLGCPQPYVNEGDYDEGDKVSHEGRAYECKVYPYSGYCKLLDFIPGTEAGKLGWTDLGWCDGSIAPTKSPSLPPNAQGCPLAYSTSTNYEGGDSVEKDGIVYKCRQWPEGGYCNAGPSYAPGSANSNMGWIKMGSCTGTIEPTTSPTHAGPDSGGCNHSYLVRCSAGPGTNSILTGDACLATYKAGVRVEYNQFLFECKSDIHASKYCSQKPYGPDGIYWSMAWNKIGWCDGTLAPTKSPSAKPSVTPSVEPSSKPSTSPSSAPSLKPSASPSDEPSLKPSTAPSDEPSLKPSSAPSLKPSASPSDEPSLKPSSSPTKTP